MRTPFRRPPGRHLRASNKPGAIHQPDYQRLTDEQRGWIKHIVHTEDGPCRGRPRTDIRTTVDAALYKTRTDTSWRELPAEFGSWQTTLRRYRQLIESSQWDEITRTLSERDLPQ